MTKENFKEDSLEKTSKIDKLISKIGEINVSKDTKFLMNHAQLTTSDFYYHLQLNQIEILNAIGRSHLGKVSVPVKNKKEKSKKQKTEKRKITKIQSATGKLKNLSITVQNDQHKQESNETNSTKEMIDKLKKLQLTAKTTTDSISSAKVHPELKTLKIMKRELRKRDEILLLNRQIKEKISKNIKPKLMSIISTSQKEPINGIIGNSKVTLKCAEKNLPKIKMLSSRNNDRTIIIPKTKLSTGLEIQRYTIEQLYRFQEFGTWEIVPKLVKLKICGTNLNPLDEFLFSLFEMSENERTEAILRKAEERKLIKIKEFQNFIYLSPEFTSKSKESQQQMEEKPSKFQHESQKKPMDFIDNFRLIANNDEELNKLIYRHELINLFENELKEQDLSKLTKEEIIQYLLDSNQAFIMEGEIRINQKNNQEAYVTHKKGMKDICINKLILRKHAFQGDLVKVLVKKNSSADDDLLSTSNQLDESTGMILDETSLEISSESRIFGCVLEILEKRHSRRVIGSFAPLANLTKNRRHLMINVRDPKIPNVRVNIRGGIPTDVELSDKFLLTVEILNWNYDQPQGQVLSIIGKKGQLKTENQAILQANNLNPIPFDKKIIDSLPNEPFQIPQREYIYREDLRKKLIFSIDPESARDLDDALSCEVLGNGNLEIGVHISDVSYFVKENSELDNIIKDKATTIYLVDTVYHMLPEKLCFLCSLLPGSDKLSYSVFFEMNSKTAEIYNTRYTRSIVNSCAKLSYEHAQMIIEKKNQDWSDLEKDFPEIYNGFTVSQIADVIIKLQNVAIILRANRKANGALKIEQPKLSFIFAKDDQKMEAPIDYSKYCSKDSNRLIEEFMLLANIYVAKYINEKFPNISLLRKHDPPNENALKKLTKVLNKHNVQLDSSSSTTLSKSMENLITFAKYPNAMRAVINHMVSKTMTRAKYFCSSMAENSEDFWHYALSIPIYTHFTSPIRRYADVLVHRLLNAALNYEQAPSRTPEKIQDLANICNVQKYNAKLAGDDSSNLYFIHFVKSLKSKTMSAGVLGIYEFNLEVILINTGHLLKVYYKNLQQNDDVVIKTFSDSSPPYVYFYLPKTQHSVKVEFGSEVLLQVEVFNDKLIVNKIFCPKSDI